MTDSVLVKDLKKGDVFSEIDYGIEISYVALEDARRIKNEEEGKDGYECNGRALLKGNVVDFFQDKEITHYGPKLYRNE